MADPNDPLEPEKTPPAASVRRKGESRGQQDLRMQGYSDEQIDYSRPSPANRGSGNPLANAYRLAVEREKIDAQNARQDKALALDERALEFRDREAAARLRIEEARQAEKDQELNEINYYMDERNQLAEQYGMNSREYLLGVLSMSRKYGRAIRAEAGIRGQLAHYDELLTASGMTNEAKTAATRLLSADLSLPTAIADIDAAILEDPNVLKDPTIAKLYEARKKDASAAEIRRRAVAGGLQQDRSTSDTLGGSETFTNPKAEKDPEKPDTYEQFNKDLEEARKAYEGRGSLPGFLQRAFDERGQRLEKPFREGKPAGAAGPAGPSEQPAAAVPIATNPKTGQKMAFRDGKWQPL